MIALVNVAQVHQSRDERPHNLPMGLIYLGSALKKAGYQVKLYHISQYQIEDAAYEIAKLKPLFVGVSVLTGVSTLHNLEISRQVRNLEPSIPIIWGGHHPSAIPEQCLAESSIDYVFMGEGEEGIVQFARAVESNKGFDSIPGLAMKRNGMVIKNSPPILIKDLDTLNFDLGVLDNASQYVGGSGNAMMFQSSRGCPFRCGFCHIANFYSHSYRQFSIEYVLHYAKKYRDMYGVNTFHMTDDILFCSKRDIAVMQGVRDLGLTIGVVALRISHLYKNPDIMKVLQDLGVTAVFLAWESGVDRILKLMHKDINQEIIFKTIQLLADKYPQITCSGGAIIGNPTETLDEIRQTVKTAVKIRSIHSNFHTFLQLYLPLPGTEFLELAVSEGMARPTSSEEWAYRDPFWNKTCQIDWLPWATSEHKQMLVDLNRYYCRIIQVRKGGRIAQFIIKLFSVVAAFRLNHLCFIGSEIDIWLFEKLIHLRRKFLRVTS